jgi:hypothetical protein
MSAPDFDAGFGSAAVADRRAWQSDALDHIGGIATVGLIARIRTQPATRLLLFAIGVSRAGWLIVTVTIAVGIVLA